jgi:hypothetical protein
MIARMDGHVGLTDSPTKLYVLLHLMEVDRPVFDLLDEN